MDGHYPFELPPLSYSYHALEPYIDSETMRLHHDKHFGAYVENLNRALEKLPAYHHWPLTRLIRENGGLPFQLQTAVWNNAGGVYNHDLYFRILGKPGEKSAPGPLSKAIETAYGSFENFEEHLKQSALSQFGSGYAWLVSDRRGRLKIVTTLNQGTPLPRGFHPILLVDVWEHAYYLRYRNRRAEYLDAFFHVLNYTEAENNYLACITRPSGNKTTKTRSE